MNNYGMPFSELLERLDKFMQTEEYEKTIDNVGKEIIEKAEQWGKKHE